MSKKISELTTATDVTVNDFFQVVDLEDSTMAASGTNKKISARTLGNNLPVTATGSSASRSLKDRFADTVNVKDFGAVGDGVTDDTSAIQAAITAFNSIFIPDGIYMMDYISISKKIKITLSNSATLKNRVPSNPAVTLDNHWGIFKFMAGSAGSVIEGGTLDGNREGLATYYNGHSRLGKDNHWWGIRAEYVEDICIKDIRFRNFMNDAFYAYNSNRFKALNIDVRDCGVAFTVQGAEDIWNTGAVVNVTARNIGNVINGVAYYMFQHGAVFCNQTDFFYNVSIDGFCGSKQGTDNNSTSGGKEPVPAAAAFYKLDNGVINASIRNYTTPANLTSKNTATDFVTVSNCSGSLDTFGFEHGAGFGTCIGNTFDLSLDGNYINIAGYPREGILITFGGVLDVNVAGLAGETTSNLSSRDNIFTGTVQRFGVGVRDEGMSNNLSNLSVFGNVTDGIQLVSANGSSNAYPTSRNRLSGKRILIGTKAFSNGEAGIIYTGGSADSISNCFVRDNAQTFGDRYFPVNIMVAASTGEGVDLAIQNNDCDVTTPVSILQDVSFVPGTASLRPSNTTYSNSLNLTHTYQVLSRTPNNYTVGQIVKLKNVLAGNQDVDGKIIDIQQDYFTLAHSAAVVYDTSNSLVNLSGTIAISGVSIAGVNTLFLTEVDFPVYLKYGTEYRRIVYIYSNTSALVDSPFSSNVPSGTIPTVVKATAQTGIITPLYAFSVNENITNGPLMISNNRHRNKTATINPLSFQGIAAGSTFTLEYSLAMTGTNTINPIVVGLPNWAQVQSIKATNVTAITGVTGNASIVVKRTGTVIATPLSSLVLTVGAVNKGSCPDCPSFQQYGGQIDLVSDGGNPTGTILIQVTFFKSLW